jgi:signal transduction histidine kinase/CheY-like chemotaxis protein
MPPALRDSDRSLAALFITLAAVIGAFAFVSLGLLYLDYRTPAQGELDLTHQALFAVAVALLALFGFILRKLHRVVVRPIAALSDAMERYQRGDFAARVPLSGRGEIGYLETSFNELAERIEAMVRDLRKLDEMKSEFISTVSHELRTPLTSIGGYVKLLAAGDAGPVAPTQAEFLQIVDANVARLTALINDILDVEKMESGKVQLVREPVDLAPLLKECRDTLGVMAQQKGLELRARIPGRIRPVSGDRARLFQVFTNLLSNAVKYTRQGYVELEAEERDFAVVVRVRDTGVGLSPQEQERLFQKFYRTRSGLTSREGGSGLGLVIARGMVEAHGGSIAVESQPGEGTVFTVSLPFASPAAGPRVEEPTPVGAPAPTRAPERVPRRAPLPPGRALWIVDANGPELEAMRAMIEQAAPLVRGAVPRVKGFAGLGAVPEVVEPVDAPLLVVLDPASAADGISELRRKLHKAVPILVVSGTVSPSMVFAEGASALLSKPVKETELVAAVRDLIAARGWRVLLADKSQDFRLLAKRALEQRGLLVDDVDRGNLVMGRLEQEDYDLALIDLGFPDVSGQDLLTAIRRRARLRSLPVFVMLDGAQDAPSREQLTAWGADLLVGKYRGIGGVVETVCQYLEDKKILEQHH